MIIRVLLLITLLISAAPRANAAALKPFGLTDSTPYAPLSLSPVLRWNLIPEAICYEMEVFFRLPEDLAAAKSSPNAVWRTKHIYANAFNLPLQEIPGFKANAPVFWRVRPLDQNGEPIGQFSNPATIYASADRPGMDRPVATGDDAPLLLYPTYSWIKQYHASHFQLEIYGRNPDYFPTAPRLDTLESDIAECYDSKPRTDAKAIFWRVRSFDENGRPLGEWSRAQRRKLITGHPQIAVYGDSISHGGGRISYGPDAPQYSYLTYLDQPAANLACSGTTTAALVKRFADDVLPFRPRYLIILGGVNDLREPTSDPAVTIENLKKLARLCHKNNIRPIFLTLPPINPAAIFAAFAEETAPNWREKFDVVNDFLRTLPHIDVAAALEKYSPDRSMPPNLATDGLHGDIPAKKIMAETIKPPLGASRYRRRPLAKRKL